MYQLTDAAFSANSPGTIAFAGTPPLRRPPVQRAINARTVPSHAIELTAVLDRNVTAVLSGNRDVRASPQQQQDLAAVIHLCGAGPARAFARRGFRLLAGERCGDHVVAKYLADVNAMKRQFLRLAAVQGLPAQEVI